MPDQPTSRLASRFELQGPVLIGEISDDLPHLTNEETALLYATVHLLLHE
jgi:hypothetical protein